MVPLHVGWRSYGQPVLGVALKLWASQRLDVAVAITCTTLWPAVGGAVGVAVARVARVLVASRAARSAERRRKAGGSIEESEDKEEVEAAAPLRGTGSAREGRVPQAPKGMAGMGLPPARPPTLPPVVLPPVPPGGLAACSAQSVGLPMMLVGQSAARAPLYAVRVDRLRRGLAGLAATLLLCRRAAAGRGWAVKTPFTGRLARLPPRFVEAVFGFVVGPAAALTYLTTSAAGPSAAAGDAALCQRYTPTLQQLYTRLRGAGDAEARRSGHGVVFSSAGPSVEAIERPDINACCLPGGIVFVHSGLIKAVNGRQDSLSFVLGHEVGHAIGRHSLEKAAQTYSGMFAVDVLVGAAERLLKSVFYMLQLRQSRRHEYEADQLALALGTAAGMDRQSLFSGATDVLRRFMRLEDPGGAAAAAAGGSDSLMSTHPAASNRLRRLMEAQA